MRIIIITLTLILFSCSEYQSQNMIWSEKDRSLLVANLKSSYDHLMNEINQMSEEQWAFQENENRWSTALVVEHLEIHEALYHRELKTATSLPAPLIKYMEMNDPDSVILSYQNITSKNSGSSPWYLEPKGRWKDKESVLESYQKLRTSMITFLEKTDKNLRRYATTSGRGTKKFRDLHQMVLISIAHTRRHTKQIQKIKSHVNYPKK